MLSSFFHTVIYEPLYNGLVFLISVMPGHNIGLAVIAITIIVRLFLYPSSKKAILSQIKMKELQPELEQISKKYKENKEERARKTIELYRDKKVSMFAPILPLLFQLPIILALYYIFARSGLPAVNGDILYSFVTAPGFTSTAFFGLFDITEKNWPIAIIAGVTQFIQASVYLKLTDGKNPPSLDKGEKPSFQQDFQKSMNFQMKYVFPVFVAFFAHSLTAAIALYWTTSNIFSIFQEIITRKADTNAILNTMSIKT